jgi:TonB family protein
LTQTNLENLYPKLTAQPAESHALAAPDVARTAPEPGGAVLPSVIALSAEPAPPTALLELPQTQLRARFSTGPPPDLSSGRGLPGTGLDSGIGAEAAGGREAPNLLVTPAGPVAPGPVMVGPAPANAGEGRTEVGEMKSAPPATASQQRRAQELLEGIAPGTRRATPGTRRIYTVTFNLPNLSSPTGSWLLRFAERGPESETSPGGAADLGVAPPRAVTKVDPKYPAAARRARIQGSVFLYGSIGTDGRVSEVAVVEGVEEQLDQSAVDAFRRWRFEPGRKNGTPIPLEVVVEIPFRLQALF